MLFERIELAAALTLLLPLAIAAADKPRTPTKTTGVFISQAMLAKAKANAAKYPWAAEMRDKAVTAATPWMRLSDNELWETMFGATISRSWMVWSDGYCPACKKSVTMYAWGVNAFLRPWKVQCPCCKELFPKNDFHAFYVSGLDEHGVFDPKLADRKLLYNTDHPGPKDPLHSFGVDDGEGYVEGEHRWRFVGYYIVRGPWQQIVLSGVARLGTAYAVTGNQAYAHKAGILLDRVADLYPTFDFYKQGWVYEHQWDNGYVSTWHDACEETRTLAIAYDRIFDGIKTDDSLVRFLATKAKSYKLDNPKSTFLDVQRNIEDRILRDSLANRKKVESNYPQTDLNIAVIKAILEWPGSRKEVNTVLGDIVDKSTAVDGVSGEKGLYAYSAWAIQTLAQALGLFSQIEPSFMQDAFKQHPSLYKTWRFHIDTWCLQQYYPNIGDSGGFRAPYGYAGIDLSPGEAMAPSMQTFCYRLYEITRDPAYLQLLYIGNGRSVDGLPHDIFADDPAGVQKTVKKVVDREGLELKMASVNKEQWHLAILRSGHKSDARCAWLDYDYDGRHGHSDCMNLGLFAKGMDLLSDFGYPPVGYGGWSSPRAHWYMLPASHNTVVVDGDWQPPAKGKSTLWADGRDFHAIRASAPEVAGRQYERTVAMVDTSSESFYVLDVFRVVGKSDHAKMQHTQLASLTTSGLSLSQGQDFGHETLFRNMRTDATPKSGWTADFAIDERRNREKDDPDVHVRITDLTNGAEASTCEAWLAPISDDTEVWIPETIVRRRGVAPLASTFVSVIEPYDKASAISSIKRLPLCSPSGAAYGDANVALEITLTDGRRDVFIAADAENPLALLPSLASDGVLLQKDTGIRLAGEMCMVRLGRSGEIELVVLCKGKRVDVGKLAYDAGKGVDFAEVGTEDMKAEDR